MAESTFEADDLRPDLAAWAFATADLVALVLVVVLAGYWTGGLGSALAELNTLVGVGVFGVLWVLTAGAVAALAPETGFAGPLRSVLPRAVAAGMAVGMVFVGGFALVIFVPALVGGGGSLAPVLLVALVATGIAAVVGGVVGLLVGLLDAALARTAVAVIGAAAVPSSEGGGPSGEGGGPSGEADAAAGGADDPSGEADAAAGEADVPSGEADVPSGEVDDAAGADVESGSWDDTQAVADDGSLRRDQP